MKILKRISILLVAFILACTCFIGCGKNPTKPEIKNIIIIIGDGMGFEHIEAGQLYENKKYAFADWHQTTVNTDSVDAYGNEVLTDSAAGGTAIATGELTINGYVGVNPKGQELDTILDIAKALGKSTGVISTDTLFGATPADFSAHSISRNNAVEIVESQILTSNVDLLCGAIDGTCTSRKTMIQENGYAYCENINSISDTLQAEKAYWQLNMGSRSAPVKLATVTGYALDFLSKDKDGFVVMIEQAHIDKYSHNTDFDGVVKSVASLNDTVEVVLNWIGDRKDTAVFITADHETGGLSASMYDELPMIYHTLDGRDVYYSFSHGNHTQTYVGLFTYGVKPDFSTFDRFHSKDKIKNIETNTILTTLLLNPTAYN